ncbi:MAG: hypothetical protein QOC58_2005 [Mycobacterium sp.]|nr:hypothetical protein [Mycobacterium sp.]
MRCVLAYGTTHSSISAPRLHDDLETYLAWLRTH